MRNFTFYEGLIPHLAEVHWNVEYRMENSTLQLSFHNFGMWDVELPFENTLLQPC